MATTVRIERRKRGLFGWVFLLLFWVFNAGMALLLWAGISVTTEVPAAATEAGRAGAAIGAGLGITMLVSAWMAGAVILGIFVLLTPGRKVISETKGNSA